MWPRGQLSEEYMSKQRSEPGAQIITPFYCNETQLVDMKCLLCYVCMYN